MRGEAAVGTARQRLPTGAVGLACSQRGVVLTQLVDRQFAAAVITLLVQRHGGDQETVGGGDGAEGVAGGGRNVGFETGVGAGGFVMGAGLLAEGVQGVLHGLSFGGALMLLVSGVNGGNQNNKHNDRDGHFDQSEALVRFHGKTLEECVWRKVYSTRWCGATEKLNNCLNL